VHFARDQRPDDAERHEAETRLYQPIRQSPPEEPIVIEPMPPAVYPSRPTNVNPTPGGFNTPSNERAIAAARLHGVIRLLFAVLEALIAIRFVLKAVGASGSAPFTTLMYTLTAPFVGPFVGVVASPAFRQFVFEIPALLAIVIYFLLGLLVTRLIRILFIDPPSARR